MEKLIELLNEYEQLNMCRKFDSFEMHTFEDSNGVSRILEDTVISARYGFIKWLVENDKIDLAKAYEKIGKPQIIMYEEWSKEEELCEIIGVNERDYYEDIIMLLSIQDEPIKFLISVLK